MLACFVLKKAWSLRKLMKRKRKVYICKNVYVIIISSIANTQISILLLCFLYLFVELMITKYE